MKLLTRLWSVISPDRSPEREKTREREFILAANSLYWVSFRSAATLRDQIVASREQLKHLVHRSEAPNRSFRAAEDAQVEPSVSPTVEAP